MKRKRDSPHNATAETSPEQQASPQGPDKIGPTPQRDGIVLGLFDLLPAETPSKRRAVLSETTANALQTPRKNSASQDTEISLETRAHGERTPQSVGKRFMLDKFVTPKKRKRGEHGTPSSSVKEFSTPLFLRRDAVLERIAEDAEPTPRPAPWKRRGLGRSLSSMIANLKRQEEERLDEEADIMREMEMEAEGLVVPKKVRKAEVLVEDSQVQMPLGVDGLESDEEDDENKAEDGLDVNGQPKKVWKKRGQKRQTRRVISKFIFRLVVFPVANILIVKPAFVKPLPREDQVQETQLDVDQASDDDHASSGSDASDSDYASDDSHTPKKRKIEHKKTVVAQKQAAVEKGSATGAVKAVAKKISATAHANYRRLKIKSKGGNGGAGGKRFGRRR